MFGLLPCDPFKPVLTWVVDLDHTMGPRAWLGERNEFRPTLHLPANTTPEGRSLIFWAYECGLNVGRHAGEERVRDGIRSLLGISRGS